MSSLDRFWWIIPKVTDTACIQGFQWGALYHNLEDKPGQKLWATTGEEIIPNRINPVRFHSEEISTWFWKTAQKAYANALFTAMQTYEWVIIEQTWFEHARNNENLEDEDMSIQWTLKFRIRK